MRWTAAEDDYVIAHAHEGAERVRPGLFAEFGTLRSTSAVVRHGTRIGASWLRWVECPACGAKVRRLNYRTKVCESCTYETLAKEKRRILEEMASFDSRPAKRAYDRERQALLRADGDSVVVSREMSNAWSDQGSFSEGDGNGA